MGTILRKGKFSITMESGKLYARWGGIAVAMYHAGTRQLTLVNEHTARTNYHWRLCTALKKYTPLLTGGAVQMLYTAREGPDYVWRFLVVETGNVIRGCDFFIPSAKPETPTLDVTAHVVEGEWARDHYESIIDGLNEKDRRSLALEIKRLKYGGLPNTAALLQAAGLISIAVNRDAASAAHDYNKQQGNYPKSGAVKIKAIKPKPKVKKVEKVEKVEKVKPLPHKSKPTFSAGNFDAYDNSDLPEPVTSSVTFPKTPRAPFVNPQMSALAKDGKPITFYKYTSTKGYFVCGDGWYWNPKWLRDPVYTMAKVKDLKALKEKEIGKPSLKYSFTIVPAMEQSAGEIYPFVEKSTGDFYQPAQGLFYHADWLEFL